MDDNKNFEFKSLSPQKVDNINGYEEALDFAFKNDDINNIAITGVYGAGKSSVFNTYEKKKKYKCIHVSLANFNDSIIDNDNKNILKEENQNNINSKNIETRTEVKGTIDEKNPIKRVESHIINQIIHQIDPNDIEYTDFKLKKIDEKKLKFKKYINTIFILVPTLIFLWKENFIFKTICGLLNLKESSNNILFERIRSFILMVAIIFSTIILLRLINYIFKDIFFNGQVKKINYKGNEIELFDKETDSVLDKNLDEFIYVLKNSNVNAIIFEDLDRYNDITIFSKLREINFILNKKFINNSEYKPIKFIYLVRDDMFKSMDRTKFFEFIIPIVPVIDSNNSRDKMMKLFDKDINKSFIRKLSYYIDDMRLMNNIYNEYKIYELKINPSERKLKKENLLALITYKNFCPKDFAELQKNEGYVYNIFNNKDKYIDEHIKFLSGKIENIESKIELLNNSIENSFIELVSIFMNGDRIYSQVKNIDSNRSVAKEILKSSDDEEIYYKYRHGSSYENKENILKRLDNNSEFRIRKEALGEETKDKKDRIIELNKDIDKLNKEINEIQKLKLSDIIENIENAFDLETKINIEPKNLKLIKFLITNGFIDEFYFEYMGLLYENYLSKKDKEFIMSVLQGENLDYSYELKKTNMILEEFSIEDYTRTNILNYYLLDEILISNNKNLELEKLIQTLFMKNKLDFINGYFEYNTLKPDLFEKFILKINEIVTDNFRKIINSSQITYECIKKYINIILLKYTNEFNLKSNKELLKEYLDNYKDIFFEISECDESTLINTLKLLDIKLIKLQNINGDISDNLIFEIIENRLYELNIENIMYLIKKFDEECPDNRAYTKNYSILTNEENIKKVLDYVDSDIDSYLESIFNIKDNNLKNLKLRNELSEVLNILNSDAKLENKLKFIEISSFKIKNIEDIDVELWDKTIENNNILKLYSNALKYISEKDLTSNIINYINSFEISEDIFNMDNKLENKKALEEKILLNNEININVYSKICKEANYHWPIFNNFDLIDEEKIKVLIENKIIIMEENTFENIYEYYKDDNLDLINYFIFNNLEDYTKLIENEAIEFYEENMISLLENKNIKYEEKEKFIDLYDDNISLENIENIDDKLKCYIIKNKFSDNDLNYIISNYKNLDNNSKIKEEILKKVDEFIEEIDFVNIDFKILLDYMSSEFIEQENKLEVLSNTISHKNNTEILKMIQRSNIEEYKRALSGGRPKVEVNNINENILDILKEKELISKYEEIDGYYKVYGKRKINELVSV